MLFVLHPRPLEAAAGTHTDALTICGVFRSVGLSNLKAHRWRVTTIFHP